MIPDEPDWHRRLRPLVRDLVREAGRIAAGYFRAGERTTARVWTKAGDSPVTEADIATDDFLRERLMALLPQAGWLSEETADAPGRLARTFVWVVDPIDGTRAFASGDRNWVVSVALVADGRPLLGTVYAPMLDLLYEAERGVGAWLNDAPIQVSRQEVLHGARVAGPKPLVDALEREAGTLVRLPRVPSLALRLARVAEGEIDAGLVWVNACDWDIAAADLVLTEAGGRLTALDGHPPRYNLSEPVHGILVSAGAALHAAALSALTRAMPGEGGG